MDGKHHTGGRRAENGRANETATDSSGAKSWPEEPYALIGLVRDCGGASRQRLALPGRRAGRFRTTRWSVVLLSAQIAAEGRLGP